MRLSLVLTILVAVGLVTDHSAAAVFNYLDTPVDVSPAAGSWQTVNAGTYGVPAGATGVILQEVNTGGTEYYYGVRKKGSGDTWMLNSKAALKDAQSFYMIGVDANRDFEVYAENAAVQTWLIGYTMPGVTFLTNAVDKSLGTTNTWTTIDISGQTGSAVPLGAIFILQSIQNKKCALRMMGSTDDRYTRKTDKSCTGMWVGVDANEQCEMKIEHTDIDIWLVGYVTDGAVFFQDAVDKSAEIKQSYQPVDISADVAVGDTPNGALLEFGTIDGGQQLTAVRPTGSAFEQYEKLRLTSAVAGVDNDGVFEQKINDTKMDLYLVGYTLLDVNYRSIGTDTGTLYSTGTASISAGSRTVTFAGGASLPENVGQGDKLTLPGEEYYVLSRDSDTQVTIQEYATSTHTNVGFAFKRVYNTLQSWENLRGGDLVGEDRREIGVCYDDGDFTAGLDLNGSTTDSVHYMHLTVAEGQRHSGVAGGGVVLDAQGGPGGPLLWLRDPYTRVEWLELTNFDQRGILVSGGASNIVFQNLLVHGGPVSYPLIETGYDAVFRNCILYDGYTGILNTGVSHATLENVTIYDMSQYGVDMHATADITVKNAIAVGCGTTDFDLSGTINYFGNNMFSTTASFDPDAQDGGNQAPPTDLDDLFISIAPGSEDLHLELMGNLAVDYGLDLSADFTADIDGETRAAPWDIGADWEATTINYRSIGTNGGNVYNNGKATTSAGSTIVTFTEGAVLPTNIGPGDLIDINNAGIFYIKSRDSTTQVTIQEVCTNTVVAQGYDILRAYNTLQAWEDDRDGDLVGDDRLEVGVCYNDGEFTAGVTVAGSTTDAEHYMKLTVAETQRHDATAQSGARINGASYGGGEYIIDLSDDYSQLEWLEIYNFDATTGCGTGAVKTWDARDATIEYLLIHDFDSCAAAIELYHGGTIRNCLIYDGDTGIFLNMANEGQTGIVENCTISTWWCGLRAWPGAYPVEIRNTIAVGSGNYAHFDLENDTIDYFGYNMFDPAKVLNFDPDSYQGNNQVPPANLDDLFVSTTPGSENLHLEVDGHDAIVRGLDLSSYFTMDIDGQYREGAWDIGADWVQIDINYRSIGTNTGTLYSIGDATVPLDSTVVTFGFGADLPTNIGMGDKLVIGAETFYILSRDSATQVTVQAPATSAHSGETYTITRAYNTLQAWEDAVDGDLVAENRREIGVCYADGWFTDRLVISGSTTDGGRYLGLTVAEGQRHNGDHTAGAGIDAEGGWGGLDGITVEDEYTRIEYLLIKNVYDSGDAVEFTDSPAADNGLVNGLYVWGFWQNSNAGVETAAPNTTIRNSMFSAGTSRAIEVSAPGSAIIENCTMIGNGEGCCQHGLYAPSGSVTVRNTISVNHGGYDFYIETGGTAIIDYFGYNMFTDVGGGFDPESCGNCDPGTNQLPPSNWKRLFVDTVKATLDLHLQPRAHRAGNTGLDLSASFTDDVDGQTRVDAWDIGADEGISGTDPLPPAVITWKEVDPEP